MARFLDRAGRVFRSLRLTLLLSIVVPLMLLVGGGLFLAVGAVERHLDERLKEDLELVARAVSGPLSRAISDDDAIVMDETLKSIFRIGRIYGASVFGADGQQVASLGVADSTIERSRSANQVIESGELGGAFRRVEGEQVFSQFTPLVASDGRIQGLLQVTRKRSDFHELVASARIWAVAIWCGLSGLIIVVVVLGHYGAIGRHVSRLQQGMAHMAPGRWAMGSEPSGPQELRHLHADVAALGERMAAAEAEIRERVERERALAEQLEYQEKVAMIGRVAGGVAHELGAPLNVVHGRSRILQRSTLDPADRRHLEDIDHQVGRMTRIIEQLLDCFRHVPDARRPVDAVAILRAVSHALAGDPRVPDIDVRWQLPDEARILAEPTRFELAALNVVRNACQAAASRVEVRLEHSGEGWRLLVDDDGPGIEPGLRDRVFEPFFSTRPAGEGTGLGLAMVSSVVKEHQGSLQVTSGPLGGCRMILCWPAPVAESSCAPEASGSGESHSSDARSGS